MYVIAISEFNLWPRIATVVFDIYLDWMYFVPFQQCCISCIACIGTWVIYQFETNSSSLWYMFCHISFIKFSSKILFFAVRIWSNHTWKFDIFGAVVPFNTISYQWIFICSLPTQFWIDAFELFPTWSYHSTDDSLPKVISWFGILHILSSLIGRNNNNNWCTFLNRIISCVCRRRYPRKLVVGFSKNSSYFIVSSSSVDRTEMLY